MNLPCHHIVIEVTSILHEQIRLAVLPVFAQKQSCPQLLGVTLALRAIAFTRNVIIDAKAVRQNFVINGKSNASKFWRFPWEGCLGLRCEDGHSPRKRGNI